MTDLPAPVKIVCTTCRRQCDVDSWYCDPWAGKAFCPLCGEPSPLTDFFRKAKMLRATPINPAKVFPPGTKP